MPAKCNIYILSGCLFGVFTLLCLYTDSSFDSTDINGIMKMFVTALGLLGWGAVEVQGQFKAPSGVDTWCGKAYRAT